MEHTDVLIATPGNCMESGYVSSLLSTVRHLTDANVSVKWLNGMSSNVYNAREITLSGTRHNDLSVREPLGGTMSYDKILMIDSDINWKIEDALRLIESDKDMVTGAYKLVDGSIPAYTLIGGKAVNESQLYDEQSLIPLRGCGLGFACLRRGVLEAVGRPWFRQRSVLLDGQPLPVMGEDISFCISVMESGFSIWLDPAVRVNHVKSISLGWGVDNV